MPILKMLNSLNNGDTFQLDCARVTCGRDSDCNIPIVDSTISGKHCAFIISGEAYVIEDLESTNGIFVNGARVSSQLLKPGDLIRIGGIEMLYEPQVQSSNTPLPSPDSFRTMRIDPIQTPQHKNNVAVLILMLLAFFMLAATVYFLFVYYIC